MAEPASLSSPGGIMNMYDDDDDDDDEDFCRICRNPGEVDIPLMYPCACTGSIKFVHPDCLFQWLDHSNARHCEVCKHHFSFSPIYLKNTPARLPFREFVAEMAMKACHVLQFFLRLTLVLSVWFLISPFIAFWILRLAFVRSFGEAQRLFMSHMATNVLLTDCLYGLLLSACILFIYFGANCLTDHIRHLRELGGQDVRREAAERNGARVADGNGEDGAEAHAGQMIRRNAENIAALEARVEQMFDGLGDIDEEPDVPFNEFVGMQGPVFYLAKVVFTVAGHVTFIGVVIFVPFSFGRVILYYLSRVLSSATSPVMSTVMPLTESALSLANITLKNTLTAVANLTNESHEGSILGQVAGMQKANATGVNGLSKNINSTVSSDVLKGQSVGALGMSDVATLAVGYIFIFSFIFFYFGIIALIRYTRGERFYGFASVAETILRKFVGAMRRLMTMVKVAFLLVILLGVFPLMCGWWLDVCTIRMFGKSIGNRVEFFSVSPLASSLLHWIVGIIYLQQISIFVSLLRGVLRNGVLYFLRDPADPNFNPFRDLIDDPVHKHARRVLLFAAVDGSLIVMLVFLPVKLAMREAPAIFPLDISISDPFTEIPVDMLLFQICIPFAIEHFKLRTTIKSLLRYWFTVVGWVLGLTDYLLPRPEDNGGEHVEAEDLDGDEHAEAECSFVLRIVLLLIVAWMSLLIINSALIVIPVAFGRTLFNGLPPLPVRHGVKCNDLYAFVIGSYVIWTAVAGVRYSIEHLRSRRAALLVKQIWKWFGIVIKSSALLLLWMFVIPVLIGLLFELLVILPMRVPVDESPVFLLYQDWALGLIFLKIWTRLVMLPLVDESWRSKFVRVRDDGFSRLQGFWVLREIVYPIMMKLLTALCVPYVLSRGVFPVFGYPLVVNSAVYRFAWIGCLGLGLACYCGKRFHVWFNNLHNAIRDDKYLIGRRLNNFGEVHRWRR